MKHLILLTLVTTLLLTIGCDDGDEAVGDEATAEPAAASAEIDEAQDIELVSATFAIDGMTCVSCARGIESALGDAEGVHKVSVDFGARTATVDYDADLLDEARLIELVDEAGFGATPHQPGEEAVEG